MPFFLVKVADEVAEGDFSDAWKTLTGGVAPEVQTVEANAGAAFQAFLKVFAPAEATTLLNSIASTVTSGIKSGVAELASGTATNAEAGASSAAGVLTSGASTEPQPASA